MEAHPALDPAEDQSLFKRILQDGLANLEEYSRLRDLLVRELNLPPNRIVLPYSRVGVLSLDSRVRPSDVADFMFHPILASTSLVVSKRVPEILGEAGVSGWLSFPVQVTRVEAGQTPADIESGICELIAVGSGGVPTPLNQPFTRSVCPACGLATYDRFPEALRLDEEQWDGSDLFHFADHPLVFVTERARRVMQEAEFSGVKFRPSEIPRPDWEIVSLSL